MKLLIDENLPKKLKLDFSEHDVYTVADKKWNSKKNGELLELMVAENFDVLFTFDRICNSSRILKNIPSR